MISLLFFECVGLISAPFGKWFCQNCKVGGDRGVRAREKGYGRRERKEREAGNFRGQEARECIDKRLKKNIIIILTLSCCLIYI